MLEFSFVQLEFRTLFEYITKRKKKNIYKAAKEKRQRKSGLDFYGSWSK